MRKRGHRGYIFFKALQGHPQAGLGGYKTGGTSCIEGICPQGICPQGICP